jgi:hypothetical protein
MFRCHFLQIADCAALRHRHAHAHDRAPVHDHDHDHDHDQLQHHEVDHSFKDQPVTTLSVSTHQLMIDTRRMI